VQIRVPIASYYSCLRNVMANAKKRQRMRRTLVLLFEIVLTALSIKGFTQTPLTNGQVYNYNVGDIIQSYYVTFSQSGSEPPTYYTKTILTKSFSVNNDTIFYTIKRNTYRPVPINDPFFNTDTIGEMATNLTEPIKHNNGTTCYQTQDSFYLDYGNKQVWARYPKNDTDTICFEPTTHTTKFIEGLGGPFYYFKPKGGTISYKEELIYYQKGSDSWGTRFNSIIDRENFKAKIEIYPNPTNDKINIRSLETYSNFDIIDLFGKVQISNNKTNNTLDISGLKTGIYFINFYYKDLKIKTIKIIKL
jgi:hypothetical protein